VRGDDWRACSDGEQAWHEALVESAPVYYRDGNTLVDSDGT